MTGATFNGQNARVRVRKVRTKWPPIPSFADMRSLPHFYKTEAFSIDQGKMVPVTGECDSQHCPFHHEKNVGKIIPNHINQPFLSLEAIEKYGVKRPEDIIVLPEYCSKCGQPTTTPYYTTSRGVICMSCHQAGVQNWCVDCGREISKDTAEHGGRCGPCDAKEYKAYRQEGGRF